MKNTKTNKEIRQLAFDFTEEKRSVRRSCEPTGKIISLFSNKPTKVSLQNKIFKEVINNSKSF